VDLAVFKLRVGQRLGIVPTAGSLESEDETLIEGAYESLIAELLAHDLANWNASDAVPDEYADICIGMTAARLVDEFELPEPRRSLMLAQSAFGMNAPTPDERRLRRLMAVPQFDDELATDYF
jgi:hypothetical protein